MLGDDMVLAAIGTDGIDGNTDAAGAIVDSLVMARSVELGLDWRRYLDDNDSHTFFSQTGNLILTGPTGTNVADLRVLLVGSVPENVITPAASNSVDEE
jgi:hydroxypyruvate reductase/glycerate 2-kinase